MGFALGGMAIMLSFSTGRFLEAIRQKGRPDSFFMKVVASFFHFSVMLGASLLIALLTKVFQTFTYLGSDFSQVFMVSCSPSPRLITFGRLPHYTTQSETRMTSLREARESENLEQFGNDWSTKTAG